MMLLVCPPVGNIGAHPLQALGLAKDVQCPPSQAQALSNSAVHAPRLWIACF